MNLGGHDNGLFSRNMPVSPKLADGLNMKACCLQTAVVMRTDFLVMCSAECVLFFVRWGTSLRLLLHYRSAAAHCKPTIRGSGHLIAVHCAIHMISNLTNGSFPVLPLLLESYSFEKYPRPLECLVTSARSLVCTDAFTRGQEHVRRVCRPWFYPQYESRFTCLS